MVSPLPPMDGTKQSICIMNEGRGVDDLPYISCDVNGMRFVLQTLGGSADRPKVSASAEGGDQNIVGIVQNYRLDKVEENTVSLVCLDGHIYAFRNGELHEVDLGQITDESEYQDAEDEVQYIASENALIQSSEKQKENEYASEEKQQDKHLFVGKDTVNANDFVEIVTAFKCKICPYTTQDRGELLQHFQHTHLNLRRQQQQQQQQQQQEVHKEEPENVHEVKLVYMCGECSGCFPSMDDCKEHMITDHQLTDGQSPKLTVGNTRDSDKNSELLAGHADDRVESNGTKRQVKIPKALSPEYMVNKKTAELRERNVKCTYRGCLNKFTSVEAMQQHAACHTDSQCGAAFNCGICRDVKFVKWRQCSLHLWKQHQIDVDLLTCKICKVYKSATMVKLLTHMRVHSDTREYECQECGKRFKQAGQLRNHRVMHIDRKSSDTPRWYTSKTCEICGKMYADSKCLKNHIQAVHSKLRPYVCNVCGHSSAKKAMLQMHLRQHTGDKPFSCELCEYKTGDHNSLRRHMMRHTGVRPYKCPHCPYSAIQSNSYKNHLKSKHPLLSGLFTCELCTFKTVKKESYVQHIRDHEKGLIKSNNAQKKDDESVEVFPGNIAAAQLIYSCLGAFSKVGKNLEANLMSSSTSADGTSQTITIQIPSKHLEDSLPAREHVNKGNSLIEQEDDETMHCFLKIPKEEEENIDTGGITIPAEEPLDGGACDSTSVEVNS